MKVLILVLSARRTPWNAMLELSQQTWDAEDHPQTKTLYYCGRGGTNPGVKLNPAWVKASRNSDIFYSPNLSESLEDVALRTMEAFEFALELDWDFLARTHSSTYVHKRNLVSFIEMLPKENVLCGLLTSGDNPFLWGGGSYVISRDVIEKFVANKDKWNFGVMEDVGLTQIANLLGIPFTAGRMASINVKPDGSYLVMAYGHGKNFESNDWADLKQAEGQHWFRCKHDPDRAVDLKVFRELRKHYH